LRDRVEKEIACKHGRAPTMKSSSRLIDAISGCFRYRCSSLWLRHEICIHARLSSVVHKYSRRKAPKTLSAPENPEVDIIQTYFWPKWFLHFGRDDDTRVDWMFSSLTNDANKYCSYSVVFSFFSCVYSDITVDVIVGVKKLPFSLVTG